MKNSFLAPLFFLFSFLILLLVFLLFLGIEANLIAHQSSNEITFSCILQNTLKDLPAQTPLITALSFFFTFIRLRKRRSIRPITYLFLVIMGAGVLYSGTVLLPNLIGAECNENSSAIHWDGNGIHRLPFDEGLTPVYIEKGGNDETGRVMIPREKEDVFRIMFYPSGKVMKDKFALQAESTGDLEIIYFDEANPYGNPIKLKDHIGDYQLLGIGFLNQPSLLYKAICAGGLLLYLVSSWGFIRISRWNLFNLFFVLALIRISGFIYKVFSSKLALEAVNLLPVEIPFSLLPFLGIAAAGIVLLLIDLLFIPYNKRVAEDYSE